LKAQQYPEGIFKPNIKAVRFHIYGDQMTLPVYKLNSSDRLELHFDDLDANVKSYYYTYQLCDFNWKPLLLSPFDYIKGFTQQRISSYRFSSIAFTRYTHYQVILPEANTLPTKSGNYLLKVFLDGDTSKLAFTRKLLVLDTKSSLLAQFVQPFTPQFYNTHQRIKFSVNLEGLNAFDANQQCLQFGNENISLNENETLALSIFVENLQQTVTRDQLMKQIWEDKGLIVIDRNVDVLVSKLRKKLQSDPSIKILNVHGRGYKMVIEA
jgi:hypothetical protein